MLWFPLALFSTLAISLFVLSSKHLLKGQKVDPIAYGGLIQLLVGVMGLLLLLFTGVQARFTPAGLLLTLTVALLYVLSSTTYYTALKHLEASRLTIIISLEALFTQATAFLFLGEALTVRKLLAASLIVLAVFVISFSLQTFQLTFTRYDLVAVANAAAYSLAALLDSYLVRHYYSPLTYQALGFLLPASLIFLIFPASRRALPHLFNWKRQWPLLLLTSSFLFLSFLALLFAYQQGGEVSRVTPLLTTQTLLVVIFGAIFLQERGNFFRKILAGLLAIAGVYLLKI